MAATDGARILRLPGTINSKNNSIWGSNHKTRILYVKTYITKISIY